MKDDILSPKVIAQLDYYFKNKFSECFSEMIKDQKKQMLEKHRLPADKKAINDARIEKFMSMLGTPIAKPTISEIWANLGAISAPTADQQNQGWSPGTPPESYFFNYLFNLIELYLLHINQQGICVWDALTDYPINGLSKGSNGSVYKGLTNPNVGNDPTTDDGTHWYLITGGGGIGNSRIMDVTFTATGNQTFNTLSTFIVNFNSVAHDDFGLWNNSTHTATVDQTGYWNASTRLHLHPSGTFGGVTAAHLYFFVNSVLYRMVDEYLAFSTGANNVILQGGCPMLLNSGDTVTVEIKFTGAAFGAGSIVAGYYAAGADANNGTLYNQFNLEYAGAQPAFAATALKKLAEKK